MKNLLYLIFLTLISISSLELHAYEFIIEGEVNFAILPIPIPGHEVQIFSEDGQYRKTVRTDEAGLFSSSFAINDGETLIFFIETTDICTGDRQSAEVKSLDGTIYVQLLVCTLDDFPCHANFEYFPVGGLTIHFLDLSFDPNVEEWLWDFGDGQTSDEPSPIHHYEAPGIYTVTMTIFGADSCESSETREVRVDENHCFCPEFYFPVCVEDSTGQIDTFSNPCFAYCAGYEYFVACESTCNCPDTIDPICVSTIAGELVFKNACEAACAGYDSTTQCDTVSCVCPEIYAPVCVMLDDGQILEFDNECFANCAGFDDFYPCEQDCPCDRKYEPVCVTLSTGELLSFDNSCLAECAGYTDYEKCDSTCICDDQYDPVCVVTPDGNILTFSNLCIAECRGYPEAQPCDSCECPDFIEPVCVLADNGTILQFDNPCLANCAGYDSFIPCESDCDCGGIVDPVCVVLDDGSVEKYPSACEAICNGFNVFFNCDITCICPAVFDPVCVSLADGTSRTFTNSCWAECAGFTDYESCSGTSPSDPDDATKLEQAEQYEVAVYPNPFVDRLMLRGQVFGNGDIGVSLYNLLGQKIHQQTLQVKGLKWAAEISTSAFASGTYFLEIVDGQRRQSHKIIKR